MLQSICSNSGAARCWPLTAEFLRGLQCFLGNPHWGISVCFCEKTSKGSTNIVAQLPQVQPKFLLSQWEWDVHSTQENQTVSLKMQNRVNVAKWSPQVWEQKPGYLHGGVRDQAFVASCRDEYRHMALETNPRCSEGGLPVPPSKQKYEF